MENEIAVQSQTLPQDASSMHGALTVNQVLAQVHLIQQVMRDVMKDGEHYGLIPGCGPKKALFKAGAEKLILTFQLVPEFQIKKIEEGDGHLSYEVTTQIRAANGRLLGEGVGSCSTLEKKYRYTTGPKEPTGRPVPKEYWDTRNSNPGKAQDLIGGPGFSTAKVDGKWEIVIKGEKVENDNPADFYNIVLKMAKKRSLVDAVITVTATSDIFTQDIEEMAADGVTTGDKPEAKTTVPKPRAKTSAAEPVDAVPVGAKDAEPVSDDSKQAVIDIEAMLADMGRGKESPMYRKAMAMLEGLGASKAVDFVQGEYEKWLNTKKPRA